MRTRTLIATSALALAGSGLLGASASAQPVTQDGLVNVNVTDVAVQVPVGVAANICDVNVAVLVNTFLDQPSDCNADTEQQAFVETSPGGPVNQQGLVNVNLTDVSVQVPIGIAANICGVNAGVLVSNFIDSPDACDADAIEITRIT
ncbi:MAG: hypothetical protein ACJ739_13820 [Acidimicrobiales bacterium]